MFSPEEVSRVENRSTMTAYRNNDLIDKVLTTVFPIMSDPKVYRALGNLFSSSKSNLKPIDKRILSQIITNDYLTCILFSFGNYNDENFFKYARNLVTKTKNPDGSLSVTLLERLYKLRQHKSYPDLVKAFPVLEKILGEVSDKPINNFVYKNKFAFGVRLNIDSNIPILEKEAFMSQFKQIIEGIDDKFETINPLVKNALIKLVKDFFIVGILQSGFNKSALSYIEYAPVKFTQELLNPALTDYNSLLGDKNFMKQYLDLFTSYFKQNNAKYFGKKDVIAQKSTHLGKFYYIPVRIERTPQSEEIATSTNPADFTNHSGGANGYDTEWDLIGNEFGVTKHNHYLLPSDGDVADKRLLNKGVKPVDATKDVGDIAITGPATGEGQIKITAAERQMGRIAPTHTTRDSKKIRNWAQVKNADAIFAIGSLIPKGATITISKGTVDKIALIPQVNGGTSGAVQMAINENKPVYVFNQKANDAYPIGWYTWNIEKQDFISTEIPTLTTNFAGIGTSSDTTEIGKQAIRDVYQKTFSNKLTSNSANIYSQLGDKTQSENVIIKPWGELKEATNAIEKNIIISTRIKNSNEHFGNLFSHDPAGKTQGLIKTETIKEAVEKYIDWVINSQDDRAKWIRKKLKTGELKNKNILYYKELGEPSHATALDYLINKYNWNKNQPTEIKPKIDNIVQKDRTIPIDGFKITLKPDGNMYFENGNIVDNETIQNKFFIRKELQDGTLRTSIFNGNTYFVLSNNKILGSGVTNLGKESIKDPKIVESILAKATLYKTNC